VIVPADLFVFPDRRRVFYRARVGDTLQDIAAALHVAADDLRRWNDLDPGARLQEGMTLQAFVPRDANLEGVVVSTDADVHVLPVGSEEFFAALERDKGFRRVTVVAKPGDTIESIGRRYDVPARTMERINRRPRGDALAAGDPVVIYVPTAGPRGGAHSLAPSAACDAASPSFGGVRPLTALPPLAPPIPDLSP
jgi:membrane-bound lytic murein transglycosylase D